MPASSEKAPSPIEFGWSSQRLNVRNMEEDWTGTTDPVERRKLQNRLNQRARRLRARAENPESVSVLHNKPRRGRPPAVKSTENDSLVDFTSPPHKYTNMVTSAKSACINSSPQVEALMARFAAHAYSSYVQGTPALSHLSLLVKYNVSSALNRNAELLGIGAEYHDWDGISPFVKQGPSLGMTSAPYSGDWPANLLPTELQRSIEHHPWIDVFPWPKVRDNLLQAFEHPELCDEDELCHDVCEYDDPDAKPALLVWGAPWDPRSWEFSIEFLAKWGWLLSGCRDALVATNYWRARRGEKAITVKEFCEFIQMSAPAVISVDSS